MCLCIVANTEQKNVHGLDIRLRSGYVYYKKINNQGDEGKYLLITTRLSRERGGWGLASDTRGLYI